MDTERIVIIVTASVLLVVFIVSIIQAILSTRSINAVREIIAEKAGDVMWQNTVEKAITTTVPEGTAKELIRVIELGTTSLSNLLRLINQPDAANAILEAAGLAEKVLDGAPNDQTGAGAPSSYATTQNLKLVAPRSLSADDSAKG